MRFAKVTREYGLLNNALRVHYHSLEPRKLLFGVTGKLHYVVHAGIFSRSLSPRLSWCYAGEDLMLHVKRLWAASSVGVKADKVSTRFAESYAFALQLQALLEEREGVLS